MKTSIHSDKPIQEPGDDLFGRWPFAKRMAEIIRHWDDPASLVIALYGEWGEGKTSILNLMAHSLKDSKGTTILGFNPWRLGDEQQVLREFFRVIASALGKSISEKTTRTHVADLFEKYGKCLSAIPEPSVSIFGKLLTSLGGAIGWNLRGPRDIEVLKQEIDGILRKCKKRVVILIDDLDRLNYEEIDTVIRLIKLTADFPYTTYVLAFNPVLVSEALQKKFPGGTESGQAFLEKIIQVALQIPPADIAALKKIAFQGIDNALDTAGIELKQQEIDKFVIYFERSFFGRLTSPRSAKRFANAVSFGIPLMAGEVNIPDYLLLESFRIFYPTVYKAIRDKSDFFLSHTEARIAESLQKERDEFLQNILNSYGPENARSIKEGLTYLFPQTESGLGGSSYGREWQITWAKELRLCSRDYCKRYFHYGVPPGDISNKAIEQIIEKAEKAISANELKTELQKIAGQGWKTFIQKLREKETQIPPNAAKNIAIVLAQTSADFPRERGLFSSSFSTAGQAAILVHFLIKSLSEKDRILIAKEILSDPTPLTFASECYRWLHHSKEDKPEDRIFTEAAIEELGKLISGRIKETDKAKALYESFPEDSPTFYYLWQAHSPTGEVAKVLEERFSREPKDAQKLLEIFIPTSWGMDSGLSSKSEFRREQYDQIAKLIPINKMAETLRKIYPPNEIVTNEFPYKLSGNDSHKLWTAQFLWIHDHIKSPKKET
ncbi:MAG: hypothetical protein A2X34_08815 [Elusimicrobia bacterium GWC2_51_8]|nr:MAG: hypothetical protein A2X33_10565 [Elusimicrobia bacterium GWA2_51_34]OGR59991.1 MAG: hypothetical protein A2X34_08815 [Elusimicrobia bacterium GWC2_51_8]OGR86321.1 MAG: hypothetical protein A2021_06775 [Elusimicrobia bacterium GWF2_52_66]HAF95184.1 hypothetical protein [Elusimicrobiota bacterium]HCE98388.1 hypothetical protein [Elusimicrobiota bacterium]